MKKGKADFKWCKKMCLIQSICFSSAFLNSVWLYFDFHFVLVGDVQPDLECKYLGLAYFVNSFYLNK